MTSAALQPALGSLPLMMLYLDPGTGSLLFSIIMGFVTASFFVAKGLFYKLRTRLGGSSTAQSAQTGLVIYSEGKQYATTFRPILAELACRGIPCLYLSSDKSDPLLTPLATSIQTRCIGNGYAAWGYLNSLQADVCLMTTPGLDVLQIKRSRNVRHYSHIIHSPTDKAFNRPYSFDYFDSVFICGQHQRQTLQYLEQLRHSQCKTFYLTGCVYYDELYPNWKMQPARTKAQPLRVLVAPTWGKNGLLTRYGAPLLEKLMQAGLQVVIRPHPQSMVSESALLQQLRSQLESYPNLEWDERPDPLVAMADSDVLLSDISGIVFDYAFLTEKPVVTLDFVADKRGFEANDLPYEPWELRVLDIVGRRVRVEELPRLPAILAEEVGNPQRIAAIRQLRQESVVNFAQAAASVVDQLEMLLPRATAIKVELAES